MKSRNLKPVPVHIDTYYISVYGLKSRNLKPVPVHEQEKQSVLARLVLGGKNESNQIKIMRNLVKLNENAIQKCGGIDNDCFNANFSSGIMNMIKNDPYYQKQCSGS